MALNGLVMGSIYLGVRGDNGHKCCTPTWYSPQHEVSGDGTCSESSALPTYDEDTS